MSTAVAINELTAQDRCDKCSARAMVRATFNTGELLFCGHHARNIEDSLTAQATDIFDPEGVLNAK